MRRAAAMVAMLAIVMVIPAVAQASVPIVSFSAQPSSSTPQAGAHPDVSFTFEVSNRMHSAPDPCNCHDTRNVVVHLPAGLIGNPSATPKCTIAQFTTSSCPPDSQLGVTEDEFSLDPTGITAGFVAAVYNLDPPPGQAALLAFETIIRTPVFLNVSARTDSDYGIDTTVSNIAHFFPLNYNQTVIWGVPAAPVHDNLRFGLGEKPPLIGFQIQPFFCSKDQTPATTDPDTVYAFCASGVHGPGPEEYGFFPSGSKGAIGECTDLDGQCGGPGHPVQSNSPEIPFFQNPTTCGESDLFTSLDVLSYDGGESHASASYPATTDCNQLSFNPSQAINPTTTAADSPSGAEFRLTVPQFESPAVPSPSELRAAVVTLAPGFSLAPNVTNGKETCSDIEARFGTTEEAECPENAKIGTLTVETPVLPGPLPGAVYLGESKPGNRFRLVLAFDGFGVHVKLPGTVIPDPTTGQIRVSFQDLPQAPFADFNMHIFGSERGPLDTPTQCGRYEVKSEWTPWDAALSKQVSRQFFTVDQGPNGGPCPNGARPFDPAFQAASTSNAAAAHTSFSVNLTRKDGDQNLAALDVTTPPGFLATLRGLTYCPEASIAAAGLQSQTGLAEEVSPSCPGSSYVGEVHAGAGPGSHPLYVSGKAYLAGPYKGDPLSFVFITPAASGGYDLGNVVIRAALRVNSQTAQVTAVSDPLPQIFQGVPLRLRQLVIDLNRPGFALNPTNCEPLAVTSDVFGDENAHASLSQYFQVANCASLPFAPALALKATGGLRRRGHPALHAHLQAHDGEANIASVSVALPKGEILDNAHIQTPCTRVQLNARSCPPGSLLGHAVAETPLLAHPLEGSVYLTTGFGHKLPDLIADLRGQIDIQLDGKVDTVHGGSLRTTFQTVPDAPISSFTLDLLGGSKGLVQNTQTLCGTSRSALLRMGGQNNKRISRKIPLQARCSAKPSRARGDTQRSGRPGSGATK